MKIGANLSEFPPVSSFVLMLPVCVSCTNGLKRPLFFEKELKPIKGDVVAATKHMFGDDALNLRVNLRELSWDGKEFLYEIENGVTLSFADGIRNFNEVFPRGYTFEKVRGFLAKWVYLCDKELIQLSQKQYAVLDDECVEENGRMNDVIRITIREGAPDPIKVEYRQLGHTYSVRVPMNAKILDVRDRLAQAMGLWKCQVAIYALDGPSRRFADSNWDAGVAAAYGLEVVPCSRKVYFKEIAKSMWSRDRKFEEQLDCDREPNFQLFYAKIYRSIGHPFVMMFDEHWINENWNLLVLQSSESCRIEVMEAKEFPIQIGDAHRSMKLCEKIPVGDLKRYISEAFGPVSEAKEVTKWQVQVLSDDSKQLKDVKGQLKFEMECQIVVNFQPLYVSRQATIQTVKEKLRKGEFRAFSKTAELPSHDLASKYSEIFVFDPDKVIQCQVCFGDGDRTVVWAGNLPGKEKMKDILDRSVREMLPALSVSTGFELFWQQELLDQDRLLATISPEMDIELHAERIERSFSVQVKYQTKHWDMQFRMNRHCHVKDLLRLVEETLSSRIRHGLARDADQELTFLSPYSLPVQVTCVQEPSLKFSFFDERRKMEVSCSGMKMDATILDLSQYLNFQSSAPAILVDGQSIEKSRFRDSLLRHLVFREGPISFSCEYRRPPQVSTELVQPKTVQVQPKGTNQPRLDKPKRFEFHVIFPNDMVEKEIFSSDATIKDVWDKKASSLSKVQDPYKAIKYGIFHQNRIRQGDERLGEPTDYYLYVVGMLDVYVIRNGSLSSNPIDACSRDSLEDFCRSQSLGDKTLASGGIICTDRSRTLHDLSTDNVVILSVVQERLNLKVQFIGNAKDPPEDYTVDGDATVFSLLGRLTRTRDASCAVSDDSGRIELQKHLKDIKGVLKIACEPGTHEPPKERHFWFTFNNELMKITLSGNACARSAKEQIALMYNTIEEFVIIIFLGRVIPDQMVLSTLDIREGDRFTVLFRDPTGCFLDQSIEKRYHEAKTPLVTPGMCVRPDDYPDLVERLLKECPGASKTTCKRIFNYCKYDYEAAKAQILVGLRIAPNGGQILAQALT